MQITVKGEMTIAEIKQAIFEKLSEVELEHAVRYSRGATLYINPTNGFGDDIYPEVKKLYSRGPYKAAADDYKI
jgi:hypothetical protein